MSKAYAPNEVSVTTRVGSLVAALLLMAYGSYGVYINDLSIPRLTKRWWRKGNIHLHDESAIIMFGALLCGALMLLSIVIDHYDRRNNEHHYHTLSVVLMRLGFVLFGAALVVELLQEFGWLRV